MKKSRFGYRTQIPELGTRRAQTKSVSFKDGIETFKDNDDVKPTEVVRANDARFKQIGRYKTRKGLDRYSVPIGEAVNVEVNSTAGAGTYGVDDTHAVAQLVTLASAGNATRAQIRVRGSESRRGTVLVELRSDSSGRPGAKLAGSSIASSAVSSSFEYLSVDFGSAPSLVLGQAVWLVVRGQKGAEGYEVSTTTNSTDALIGNGSLWDPAAYSVNVRLLTSTAGATKGVIRVYRPNGQKRTLLAYGTTLASVNDTTGATTALKTDFSPSTTHFRMKMVQDAIYIATGAEKAWKYDLELDTFTQMSNWAYSSSLIEEHKGMIFFNDVEDKTRIAFTEFAEYDKQTSTDFIYVPAPKSYDSLTAFAKLNGVLFLFANRNKFQLYGADRDTFQLEEAASQRGTFSQESLVYDANFIYHADDEGIWRFDGSGERNLAEPFLSDYQAIPNKGSIRLDVYDNRLYCFYAPAGSSENSECFVINLLLGVHESVDTKTYVGLTFGRDAQEDVFIQASNRVAALYWGELPSNDHSNLGEQLEFRVWTSYGHFDQPGELKRIPQWRPQFPSQVGHYAIQAGYDVDNEQNPTFQDVSVGGSGPRLNQGHRLNTGLRLASQRMVTPLSLFIPGDFRRAQRRYEHIAAREPVELDSEVLSIETQRLV